MTERICWHCKKPLSDEEWIDDEEYGDVHTRYSEKYQARLLDSDRSDQLKPGEM